MNRRIVSTICLVALSINALPGCMLRRPGFHFGGDDVHLRNMASHTKYQDVHEAAVGSPAGFSGPPRLLTDLTPADFWPMTPEESVQFAISNSTVLRDLGGTVLQSPARIRSINDPALVETNPRFGVHSALAAFDAEFSTRAFFEKNDRALNNRIVGLGTQIFQQDYLHWQSEVSKRSMTGGRYTYRNTWEYDANNSMDNIFGSAWTTLMDFEARQPLLQGSGVQFNQIVGPDAVQGPGIVPGEANGVRIARLNTDVSLTEYQIALRDLVSNVENAYWDLYFAYRDLEAKIAARDEALLTWRRFQAQRQANIGEAADEAQAREQYFRFQEEVQNALNGRLVEGTEVNNGSSGGSFRGTLGVLMAERRLRLAMGLQINDGRIIRPAYDPKMVRVIFNWDELLGEALTRRAELQRQRIVIRRSELELLASRNFLLPRLDAFGRYRFRGFGKDLIDTRKTSGQLFDMNDAPIDRLSFDNAYQDLTTGDFQEWQLGFEFSMPVGFRRAHAAVRHAQLKLVRERAIMTEQERQLVYDLSNVYSEVYRAFEVMQTAYNRRIAAQENYEILNAQFLNNLQTNANLLLDAQRRLADAESRFYRAQVDYMLAIKNVHYEKGSLLDYNEVYLVGEPTAPDKDAGAARRWLQGKPFDYLLTRPINSGKGQGGTNPEDGHNQRQSLASGNPLTTQAGGNADGNAIPRDGLPMVRLPQVSLPRLDLPTLENMSMPSGPSSPAQVLPPPSPARIAQPPARPTPDRSRTAQAPSTTSATTSTTTSANQRGGVQLPFRTNETPSSPSVPSTGSTVAGTRSSASPPRPAYRFPIMNPEERLESGNPRDAQDEVTANRSANPREDRNRGSDLPRSLPPTQSPTVAELPAGGHSAGGASPVVRPARLPRLPVRPQDQPADEGPLVDLAARPAAPPKSPASESLANEDEVRSRLRPSQALVAGSPNFPMPHNKEPDSFDRLPIFGGEQPAGSPDSDKSQVAQATPSRLQPTQAAATPALSGLRQPQRPMTPMPNTKEADSFDRLPIFGGEQPKTPAPIVAAPAGATPSQASRSGNDLTGPLATRRPSIGFSSPDRAPSPPEASRPEPSQRSSLSEYVSAAPASSPAPIVDAPTQPTQQGKPNRFFRLLFGSDERPESEATAPASAELPADEFDSVDPQADPAPADSGSPDSGQHPLFRLPTIDEGADRSAAKRQPAAPIIQPTGPIMLTAPPTMQPTGSMKQPAAPIVLPAPPIDQPGGSMKQPAAPIMLPAPPIMQPTGSMKQPAAPIVLPPGPIDQLGGSMKQPAGSMWQPAAPIVQPTGPIMQPAAPIVLPATSYPFERSPMSGP